ncbi:hypothetical protein VTJ49DRAFT_1788 [Mycothermus thermophilus]|uniref:Uncharacterized protein n=1 Tax=Humicola insolens TaxID=85995 RepID=A0ABR3VBH7_HUMIN
MDSAENEQYEEHLGILMWNRIPSPSNIHVLPREVLLNPPNTDEPQDARSELAAQLDDLLNTLSNKFAGVSSEIFAKMDEMSRRLDNLEAQLKANAEKNNSSK